MKKTVQVLVSAWMASLALVGCQLTETQSQEQTSEVVGVQSTQSALKIDDRMVWTRSVDQRGGLFSLNKGQNAQIRLGTAKEEYSMGAKSDGFTFLPKHTQLTIQTTPHFIDDWQGETAYLITEDYNNNGIPEAYTYVLTNQKTTPDVPFVLGTLSLRDNKPKSTFLTGSAILTSQWAQFSKEAGDVLSSIPLKVSEKPSLAEIYAYALVNHLSFKASIFGAVIGLNSTKEDKTVPLESILVTEDVSAISKAVATELLQNTSFKNELKQWVRSQSTSTKEAKNAFIKALNSNQIESIAQSLQAEIKANALFKPALFAIVLALNSTKKEENISLEKALEIAESATIQNDKVILEAVQILNKASSEKNAKILEQVQKLLINASHFYNQSFSKVVEAHVNVNQNLIVELLNGKAYPFVSVVDNSIEEGSLIVSNIKLASQWRILQKPELLYQEWDDVIDQHLTEIQNNPLFNDDMGVEFNPLFAEGGQGH